MTGPERESTAQEIVRESLAMSPLLRAAFLQDACAGDATLMENVRKELARHDAMTLVEEESPGESSNGSAPAAPRPRGLRAKADQARSGKPDGLHAFGPYRLIRSLGEGGMGLVYLAEQESTKQLVALKLIRPGLASPKLLRRFELEVRTLGLLRHTGIARIFDAGTHDAGFGPQPYFAMEYIEGQPITAVTPTAPLALAELLQRFTGVCHAVHYAHTKGIIHRDLKPSNILVEATGCVKVLDFGVARAIDSDSASTLHTEVGQLVGTLPYMSPEQISGDPADLDTRSDIYALGVILYEMISGRLPHDISTQSLVDAVRTISTEDPSPLRSHNSALPLDVRTICFKALERDRDRRYQSASDLAADVERFLRNEPITARTPSTLYLASRFARRHKALVTGAASVLLVLTAGVATTATMAVRATVQRDRAVAAELKAEESRARAVEDAATAKAISGFLTTMLSAADPEKALGRELTVRDALDSSAATIADTFKTQSMVEAEARLTLGQTYLGLGEFERSEIHLTRAYELLREHHGADSRDTLNAARQLSMLDVELGRHEIAEPRLRDALERLTAQFGERDRDAIAAGADLARVLVETGRVDLGEQLYRSALERARETLPPQDEFLLTAMHNLASCVKDQGRLQEAEPLMRAALVARRDAYGAEHPQTLFSVNSLAATLSRLGQMEEAEQLFRTAVEGRQHMLGVDHASTALARQNLANHLIIQGRLAEAAPEAEAALAVFRERFGDEHARTIVAINALGYLKEELNELDAAEIYYRQAVDLTKRTRGMGHPETFAPLNNFASLLQRKGDPAAAALLFEELDAAASASLPPSHYILAIFRNNRGDCLRALGNISDAESLLLSSRESLVAALGDSHARVTKATQRLITLYESANDAPNAARWRESLPAPATPE